MKKIYLLTTMVISAFIAQAQKGNITISAGTTNNVAIFYEQKDADDLKMTLTGSIPIHIEAGYFLSDKFQLSLAYNRSSLTSSEVDYSSIGLGKLSLDVTYSSYMIRGNYFYINKEKFKLGSGLGFGTLVQDGSYKQTGETRKLDQPTSNSGFAIHLNVLDARYFFTENIGIYATGGFVKQGLFGIGVIGKF
jgi:hypothetical protein